MIDELRKQLHTLLKEEIEKDGLDVVAERYGINKTDRVKITTDEFDGKFSKFVEVVEAKGMRVVISDNITTSDEISDKITELTNEIVTKDGEIEVLNANNKDVLLIVEAKNDEIAKLKEEILKISKEKAILESKTQDGRPKITPRKPKEGQTFFQSGIYGEY